MGRWTYYSPVLAGILLVAALNESIRGAVGHWNEQAQWWLVVALAAAAAVQCQTLMVGAQGAFAQVLPVPGGKSIRGAVAMLGGVLLIVWVGLGSVAALLATEGLWAAVYVLVGLAGLALVGVVAVYLWEYPAAQRDFSARD